MPDTEVARPLPAMPNTAREKSKLDQAVAELIPILYRTDASPQLSKLLNIIARGKTMGAEGCEVLLRFARRLRQLRAFDDLYILTSEMNADGLGCMETRRLEVQALVELGVFETALEQVRPMLAAKVDDGDADKAEDAREAYGLLGRIYKQMFVEALRSGKPVERQTLQLYLLRSFNAYMHVWQRVKSVTTTFHAVNALAVAQYGLKQKLTDADDEKDVATLIKVLSQDILDKIAATPEPNIWALATRAEALVAQGRYQDAALAYAAFADEPGVDPFALGAALRQLEEVWLLDGKQEAEGRPVRILKASLLAKLTAISKTNEIGGNAPGSLEAVQVKLTGTELRLVKADLDALPPVSKDAGEAGGDAESVTIAGAAVGVSGKDSRALQKAFGINGPHGRRAIRKKLQLSSAVCRIEALHNGDVRGIGTGFAIKGEMLSAAWAGKTVIVTNNHVVSARGTMGAKRPEYSSAVFIGDDEKDVAPVKFARVLWESDVEAHDITILEPAGALPASVTPLSELVDAALGPRASNDEGLGRCYVIGFPNAGELCFSLADNILLDHDAPPNCIVRCDEHGARICEGVPANPVRIHYRTPTVEGNSGSPVFDENQIALLAVHHAGHREMQRLNNKPGTYAANEGIWIESIRQAIANSPLHGAEGAGDVPNWWAFQSAPTASVAAPADPGALIAPAAAMAIAGFAGNPKPGISAYAPELIYPPGPADADDRRAAQLETVIGVDNRTRVLDTQMSPWRMVCAIRARWGSRLMVGTGCFIGPDAILTAGHVVHAREFQSDAQLIEVIPGLNHERLGGEKRPYESATVKAGGIHVHPNWKSGFSPRFDVAVIRVDRRLGDEVGWFGVEARGADQLLQHWAHVTGYPGEMKEERPKDAPAETAPVVAAQLWHHAAPIERAENGRLFYKTDTTPGQSGAPVYVLPKAGQYSGPVVVGVHAYGVRSTPGAFGLANSGVWIDAEMLKLIREWSGR